MSWTERIQQTIKLTTADGSVYEPLYLLSPRRVDFNVSQFEFPNIDGTLVNRQNIKGYKYDITIVFQELNHRETYLAFEKSVKDKRPIEVLHPMYGLFNAHIISMVDDPTGLGTTRVSLSMIETISEEYPKTSTDANNQVGIDFEKANESIAETFDNNTELSTNDNVNMQSKTDATFEIGSASVNSGEQSNEYILLYNSANNSTTDLINFLSYPSYFVSSVFRRLNLLKSQYESLSLLVSTPNDKKIYELYGNAFVSAMINTSITPQEDDYENANDVLTVIDLISSVYNDFITNLDNMQTDNGSQIDSYIPNYETVNALTSMVNYALSNLFDIALTANQQRKAILNADSNVILLAHRFYGSGEENINKFMNQNSMSLSEVIEVKKDREIVYYV